jgi:MYXO-CTERM domain-containing protein
MTKRALSFHIGLALFAASLAWTGSASAYDTYSTTAPGVGNCATAACHGDFQTASYVSRSDAAAWGDELHIIHRDTMIRGGTGGTTASDCNTCHTTGGRRPVHIDSSTGGRGLAPIGCVGCHGRAEDDVAANPAVSATTGGSGAGLRQHHDRAGITVCQDCHADADTTTAGHYVPVGENVLPPYYATPGTNHPRMPNDSCNPTGQENFAATSIALDNDGDGVYDMLDSDCITGEVNGTACVAGTTVCASGNCVDGFCCDTTCGGGSATDCQACSAALNGGANGTCGNVTAAAAIVCRAAATTGCDVAETCAGGATCPTDGFAADGTACNDTLACNVGEACTAGACGGGGADGCDDGDACTTDACAEPAGCTHTPITGCEVDAGPVDVDAGPDADGGPAVDAGPPVDGGPATDLGPAADLGRGDLGTVTPPPPADEGGCGCVVAGAHSSGPSAGAGAFLALLVLAGVSIRRRRSR